LIRAQQPAIIPFPAELTFESGRFQFNEATVLCIDPSMKAISDSNRIFWEALRKNTGLRLREHCAAGGKNSIRVIRSAVPSGGYQLVFSSGSINISVSDASGLHAAGQTLLQLLPEKTGAPVIPALTVRDAPAFPYTDCICISLMTKAGGWK